jgi:hypothetical protein
MDRTRTRAADQSRATGPLDRAARRVLRNVGRVWLIVAIVLVPYVYESLVRRDRLDDTFGLLLFVPMMFALPLLLASLGYSSALEIGIRTVSQPRRRGLALLLAPVIPMAAAATFRSGGARSSLALPRRCRRYVDVWRDRARRKMTRLQRGPSWTHRRGNEPCCAG